MAFYFVITFDVSNKLLSLLKFTEEEQAASITIEEIRIVGLIFISKNTRQNTINFIFYYSLKNNFSWIFIASFFGIQFKLGFQCGLFFRSIVRLSNSMENSNCKIISCEISDTSNCDMICFPF